MTTPAHAVSYALMAYYCGPFLSRRGKYMAAGIAALLGALPDVLRPILNEGWDGTYRQLHQLVWYNAIFFFHTVPDYLTHDHVRGGWTPLAYVIEVFFWATLALWFMLRRATAERTI